MVFLSSFFSAFVWMLLGMMLLRAVAFRRYSRMRVIWLSMVVTPAIAIGLATRGLRTPGVPADVMGAARIYVPAAVVAGLLLVFLERKHRA
jgi:hypothetical protein